MRERWFGATGRRVPELAREGEVDVGGALVLIVLGALTLRLAMLLHPQFYYPDVRVHALFAWQLARRGLVGFLRHFTHLTSGDAPVGAETRTGGGAHGHGHEFGTDQDGRIVSLHVSAALLLLDTKKCSNGRSNADDSQEKVVTHSEQGTLNLSMVRRLTNIYE